ncbi:hypothetical protein N9878_00410 [bacterium]|nr:hypothetical protein [bacterium]
MKAESFNKIVQEYTRNITELLASKGDEYSRGGDRLSNFKNAAHHAKSTPAQALVGMKLKHDVSINDMIEDSADGLKVPYSRMKEKIGDAINYLILLHGCLEDANLEVGLKFKGEPMLDEDRDAQSCLPGITYNPAG